MVNASKVRFCHDRVCRASRRYYKEGINMASESRFREEFSEERVQAAVAKAVAETLAAGVPIFYFDRERGINIMEQPDGRKFEIRTIPGASEGPNYEVVREIDRTAA
jgi:hypothetical protein